MNAGEVKGTSGWAVGCGDSEAGGQTSLWKGPAFMVRSGASTVGITCNSHNVLATESPPVRLPLPSVPPQAAHFGPCRYLCPGPHVPTLALPTPPWPSLPLTPPPRYSQVVVLELTTVLTRGLSEGSRGPWNPAPSRGHAPRMHLLYNDEFSASE